MLPSRIALTILILHMTPRRYHLLKHNENIVFYAADSVSKRRDGDPV